MNCHPKGLTQGRRGILWRARRPSPVVVGAGDNVRTSSSTGPPQAEGGHGLAWLKVTPLHLTGLVGLLPSQLERPLWS